MPAPPEDSLSKKSYFFFAAGFFLAVVFFFAVFFLAVAMSFPLIVSPGITLEECGHSLLRALTGQVVHHACSSRPCQDVAAPCRIPGACQPPQGRNLAGLWRVGALACG